MIGKCWTASKADTFGHWLEETGGWLHIVATKGSSKYATVIS